MNNVFLRSAEIIKETLVETSFLRGGLFSTYGGEYFCDCSSLISSILRIENEDLFSRMSGKKNNLKSHEYFDYAKKELSYFRNIELISLGDILCWKKDHVPKSGDSGHMAIVVSLPEKISNGLFKVRVFDSTKTPHASDSRKSSGVGEGDLLLQTSEDLSIIGLKWGLSTNKVKRTEVIAIRF